VAAVEARKKVTPPRVKVGVADGRSSLWRQKLSKHPEHEQLYLRVNCVAPGPVWTPLNSADKKPDDVAFGADTPMKRPAQPEEIAPAFVYFALEIDSSYVTGEILTLLGGETTAG
jgi:NAD(P)-dependent dehydrogenase (short-subunit alcohol dehydrogenase family)